MPWMIQPLWKMAEDTGQSRNITKNDLDDIQQCLRKKNSVEIL